MPRRQDHTPQELTELAIASVQRHLQQTAASQLSLRKIARDIGYSPGTLINLFGSYSLLLLAVNARTLDDVHQQLQQAIRQSEQQHGSPVQQLEAAANRYCQYASQHPHLWRLLFEHRLADDEPLPTWQAQRIDTLFSLIESRLSALHPAASADQCRTAARVIWSGVHGICSLVLDNKIFLNAGRDNDHLIHSLLSHYLTDWCRT